MLTNAGGDGFSGGVPTNRLPYNSRQQQPSSDSESSSCEGAVVEGPSSNQFRFTGESHASKMLEGLNNLWKEGEFCDITLTVDGHKFPAHKNVLASLSPFFKAMFSSKMSESRQSTVPLKSIEPEMLRLLLDYAYTSTILITRGNVQALLSAANLLQIIPVLEAACLFLEKHMDSANCLGIHCFAEAHSCVKLQDKARDYALRNFKEVCEGDEFVMLLPCKLTEFLRSDDLQVDREETVFQAVLRWLNFKSDQRNFEFHKVLEHVRLPLLSPYYLYDCVEKCTAIKFSAECMQLVEEAKLYHLLPDRRDKLLSARTKPRKSSPTVEVIVAVGGEDYTVVLRSAECYCPSTHVWRALACLPFAVSKHGLVASGNNTLYMAGGEFPDGRASRSVWRYDAIFDEWQEVASMGVARSEHGLVMLDGYVYAVGGWDGQCRLDSVERYDPSSNSWSIISSMNMAVTSPAVAAHDAMLYVTGGAILEDGDGIEIVQRYNPLTDTWDDKCAAMLIPRSGSAACVLDGCIYVVGGWHASTENTNRVECYSISNDKWEFKGSMCESRYRPGITVIDGFIYVLGGEEGMERYHDTIERYDPKTNTWDIVGEMPTSRSWLSCARLQVRKVVTKEKSL